MTVSKHFKKRAGFELPQNYTKYTERSTEERGDKDLIYTIKINLRHQDHHNFPWDDFIQDLGIMSHKEKQPISFTFIYYALCFQLCCQIIISKPLGHFCPLMKIGNSSFLLSTYSRVKEHFNLGRLEQISQ